MRCISQGWDALRRYRLERLQAEAIIPSDLALGPLDENTSTWAEIENKDWFVEKMAVHAAMVEHLDRGVGEVASILKAQGQLDDT